MATLRNRTTNAEVTLRGRTLVGRSPRADVRLTGEAASNEHACIHWDGSDWMLRDLTSRNGTKLNGAQVIGRQWRLEVGDEIVFGDPAEHWHWVDGAAPGAKAVRDDDAIIESVHGLLVIPDEREPQASLYARDGHWEMDHGGATRPVVDGEVVTVGGRQFRLALPNAEPTGSRTRTLGDDRDVRSACARFRVSLDEENVELALQTRSTTRQLGARSLYYMLAVLARARQTDAHNGIVPDEAGWMYTDDLATKLGVTPQQINVNVHRARDGVAATRLFVNPGDIVERRRSSGQLRFGLGQILIEGAGRGL